jgi:ATP-dependent Clp protease ATP-binding subunit ClpA
VASLLRASFDAASTLRQPWVGSEHLLIAIANDADESAARCALAACGVNGAAVTDYVASFTFDPPELALEDGEQPKPKPKPNPHFYRVLGRAEGFAFATGSERPLPEHVLLALIWDEDRLVSLLLEGVGRTPVQLQAALAALGVSVPEQPPPLG